MAIYSELMGGDARQIRCHYLQDSRIRFPALHIALLRDFLDRPVHGFASPLGHWRGRDDWLNVLVQKSTKGQVKQDPIVHG